MSAPKKNEEVEWARDVLAVYKAQGKDRPPKTWPSSRKELFRWAAFQDNQKELFTKLTPKAIEILGKYDNEQTDNEIVRQEKKSIADLTVTLREAVRESQK